MSAVPLVPIVPVEEETNRPFYIIFSNRALENIGDLIESYYERYQSEYPEEVLKKFCLLVPDKFNHEITTRSIVVIDDKIFQFLKESEDNIDDFKIVRLKQKLHFYPNVNRGELPSLYIMLDKNVSLSDCQKHLYERMSCLREYGIWTLKDYHIDIPGSNRSSNTHKGTACIYFNKLEETRLNDIALTRLFINNTKWIETNQEVHCHWVRNKSQTDKIQDEKGNDRSCHFPHCLIGSFSSRQIQ